MADIEDVRRIAEALPDGRYDPDGPSCLVGEATFGWTWRERVHPRRTKVPRPDVMVVRVAGLDDKDAVLAEHPDVLFTEPHYDGYPMVLVRVPEIGTDLVTELLTDSHRLTVEHEARKRRRKR